VAQGNALGLSDTLVSPKSASMAVLCDLGKKPIHLFFINSTWRRARHVGYHAAKMAIARFEA
jgi:hypothetical protein